MKARTTRVLFWLDTTATTVRQVCETSPHLRSNMLICITLICKSCFYHIRDLRRIRRHISISTAKTISTALISSRLDYCNSLLNNIAKRDLAKLQRVQNCLARVVLRAPRFSPSLPLLKQLHWLPVSYRINFKLSTLAYRALSTQQPSYLASLLHLSNIPRQLRSSISQQLIVPKTKLNLGKRAFSVAAPRVWNEFPITLKTSETIAIFRKKLKTSIPNCFPTINVRLSLVLTLTFARPCLRLRLLILFCRASELRFLRI